MGYLSEIDAEETALYGDPEDVAEGMNALNDALSGEPSPAKAGKSAPKAGINATAFSSKPTETDREAYERLCSEHGGDSLMGLFHYCFERNVFYHERFAKSLALSTDDAVRNAMPAPYLDALASEPAFAGLTFFSQLRLENFEKTYSEELLLLTLSPEDRKNRQQILGIVNYDPFADEPSEDRPQMYRDLAGLLTDAMRRDITKRNAAIEIVHDYTTISRYQRRLAALEMSGKDDDDTRERIDNCIKMISKMQDTINKLTKENGFSSGKGIGSSGRGGLSEVMSICEEKGYDPEAPNVYDIETSKAISEVAAISTKSMLNQVNLSGTDYAEILTRQCDAVLRYRDAALRAIEAARIAESKLEKQALLEEYRRELEAKGISPDDVLEIVNQEIEMYDGQR